LLNGNIPVAKDFSTENFPSFRDFAVLSFIGNIAQYFFFCAPEAAGIRKRYVLCGKYLI